MAAEAVADHHLITTTIMAVAVLAAIQETVAMVMNIEGRVIVLFYLEMAQDTVAAALVATELDMPITIPIQMVTVAA